MSNHEEHHNEKPKRVYFGIPFAFAFTFWFIVFLCLKSCDGPKNDCCKDGAACTKECKAKCETEGKTDCVHKEAAAEEKKEGVSEEKKDAPAAKEATEKEAEKPAATEEKH